MMNGNVRETNNRSIDVPIHTSVRVNRGRIVPVTAVPVAVVSADDKVPVSEVICPVASVSANSVQRASSNTAGEGEVVSILGMCESQEAKVESMSKYLAQRREDVSIDLPSGRATESKEKDVDNTVKYLRQFVHREW